MKKIAISGVYQSKFGELWDKTLADLLFEAAQGCINDAGIDLAQVQCIFIGNMLGGISCGQEHLSALTSQVLGTSVPVVRVEAACASGGMAIRQAVTAIRSDEYDNALVIGVEKMSDVTGDEIAQALMSAAGVEEQICGLSFPGLYALLAKAYMSSYSASECDLAKVAVKNHYHASKNAKAQFPFEITSEQVLGSQKIADPLKLLDCSPISDGAAAVLLANPNWLKKQQAKNGIYITGSGQAQDTVSLAMRHDLLRISATYTAAQSAFKQAGIETTDISCLEVHDCFTIAELLALEELGICPKGEAFERIHEKDVWLGGRHPVNTSGGLKACGHPVGATGVKQIVELTLQLRKEAHGRQVEHAKIGVAHNVGGTGGTAVVHVLSR